jgi:hypothetical protein
VRRESVVVPESELEVLDPSKLGERSEELKAKLLSKIVSQDEAVLACVEHVPPLIPANIVNLIRFPICGATNLQISQMVLLNLLYP